MAMGMAMEMALLAIVSLQLIHVSADDIVGCGGFVESSPALAKLRKQSDPKLDYSNITVMLKTLEGLVKDKTLCAPNGYYYLPVYEKGSFLLQVEGPPGWHFTPSQVPVRVDQHGCNGNEDINFHYTGFTLSGKVFGSAASSCKKSVEGPSGVKVSLSGQGDQSVHRSTVTGPGGDYKFENLLTGSYQLEASHPTLDVDVLGDNVVQLGWGNGAIDNIFHVPGYSVEGSVMSKGIPVLGVHIFLHSDDVREIQCPQGPGLSPATEPALCHAISDAEGKFKFRNVPCGDYKLVPFYKGENTVFGVSPTTLSISVGHESLVVEETFQVTGFSVGGRVVDNNGNGIEQVKVYVDNIERAITDVNGMYKLDEVTSTKYTITAEKEHYKFTSLKNFMVLPNMASMPSIEATTYDVCGLVHVDAQYGKRQVALTHGPSRVKPQTKRVDEAGNFCFEVPAGEYRLSPMASLTEQQAGLLFSPQFLDVVVSAPVLDLVFRQAEVTVSGHVKCKTDCGTGITVSLDHAQPGKRPSKVVPLGAGDEFKFENVLPGKYKLHVNKARDESVGDNWCWEQDTLDIEVLTADVQDLQFVQKGYWLWIDATHATNATLAQDNMDLVPLQIKKGSQRVCIEKSGVHELRLRSPCFFFGADSFTFDTSKPKALQLKVEKYLLNGHIEVCAETSIEANKLDKNLLVEVWDKKEGKAVDTAYPLLASEASETNPVATYAYTHWARLGDELSFFPRADNQSEQVFLFYPKEHEFRVSVDGCQPKLPTFAARPGVYITGSVVPVLAGVAISVFAVHQSVTGQLEAGSLAMEAVTGGDGTFVAGPLYDETDYTLQAAKAGYHFKQSGKYSFESQKLAEIVVNIAPGDHAEETLPSVLLSLSGDDGYRKNAIASGGKFIFDSMFPGVFYLRPLLKEYSFNPPAQAIELGSGESLEVTFTARRTGYSVFGTVTSLAGKPEAGIYVEARSESGGYYEETKTDADGKYRLRGLVPDALYNVQVVIKEDLEDLSKLERASPSVYPLKISNNDTSSVDFVVFEHMGTTVTGTVEGNDLERWQAQVAVQLLTTTEPEKVVKEVELPLSYHFEIRDVPCGKYLLRLVSKQATQSHTFHSDVRELDLTKERYVHLDGLRFYAEEQHQKQDLAPAPVFPVLIGIFVISLFAAVPSLKDKLSANSATVATSMGRKEVPRSIQRKRI